MAAPTGNQFWKLRSKHGRDKLFATPDLLWEAACEYFEWCRENPWIKVEQSKSIAKPVVNKETGDVSYPSATVNLPTERPLTISGLCLYLDCNVKYFSDFKKNLKEQDKDFSPVITRIEEVIYTQKFEGAAVGAFNANIIARDLGLSDKVNTEHSGEVSVKQITGMEIK